jgi:hypothetical protein
MLQIYDRALGSSNVDDAADADPDYARACLR